ncbi:Clip-Associating Protein 1, partial [Manis pentadactyla]
MVGSLRARTEREKKREMLEYLERETERETVREVSEAPLRERDGEREYMLLESGEIQRDIEIYRDMEMREDRERGIIGSIEREREKYRRYAPWREKREDGRLCEREKREDRQRGIIGSIEREREKYRRYAPWRESEREREREIYRDMEMRENRERGIIGSIERERERNIDDMLLGERREINARPLCQRGRDGRLFERE